MIRKLIILAPILLLSGCAEVHTLSTSPNGHNQYEVECNGVAISMDVCYKKAAALCPNGYRELNRNVKDDHAYTAALASPLGQVATAAFPSGVKGINIECKF